MNISILTIGDELTSGRTQDANSSFIAREIHTRGWRVTAMLSVGDDERAIKSALEYLLPPVDGIIVTGGLGPTVDDITTAAVARAFGLKLITDEAILAHIKERMLKRGRPWTENNAKQALFPEGAETIVNPVGTAWGFALRREGKIITVIPGVPSEAQKMMLEGVIPLFRREFSEDTSLAVRTLKMSGVSESIIDQALADAPFAAWGVGVGFYPRFPEFELVLTARDRDAVRARENLARAEAEVEKRLPGYVFARDGETLESLVADLLGRRNLTLALAESCTGGLIADRITDVPGISSHFERGVVSYSSRSKEELLGVPEEIIREHGTISRETAIYMAEGARKNAGTDLGLAVTGIAGPGGGSEEKPVGTVFIALADGNTAFCRHFAFQWRERRRVKVIAAQSALMILKRYLTGERLYEQ